ncbi:hypothetical protein AKJ16_DCAP16384 [Drosera capensis]
MTHSCSHCSSSHSILWNLILFPPEPLCRSRSVQGRVKVTPIMALVVSLGKEGRTVILEHGMYQPSQ